MTDLLEHIRLLTYRAY